MSADVNAGSNSPKRLWAVLACAVLVAGLALSGCKGSNNTSSGSTSISSVDDVTDYLKKKGHSSDFKTSTDYLKKDRRPWETLMKQYDSAVDYEAVYRLIGQHLLIGENLLKSSESKDQRIGEKLIREVADAAHEIAVDDWLASAICDAYLVPLFKNDEKLTDDDEQLMFFVGRKYNEAEEIEKEIDIEKLYISKAGSGRHADNVRYRLARLLQSRGENEEAKKVLKGIGGRSDKSTNAVSAKRLEKIQKITNSPAAKN
ncbi:MAG: hypothetical protein JWM68_945 [Verrucomicrobiales bacterium]|nr:hypothetical protein [Verrucomicrobiales bacterium]